MSALPAPGLTLPELMELGFHRLHSGLDVIPRVPSRLMMHRVNLMDMRDVHRVDLMNGRSLLPGGRGRRSGRGRAGDRIELVVTVDASGVDRVRDVGVAYVARELRLVLQL